jgi:predicted DCC family thiol-disulfide oxidoreductase YuxK
VAWFKSEGSIRMAESLGFPWSLARALRILPLLARALRILPLPARDRLYAMIARNRLRWFGKREVCYRPDRRYAERFLA